MTLTNAFVILCGLMLVCLGVSLWLKAWLTSAAQLSVFLVSCCCLWLQSGGPAQLYVIAVPLALVPFAVTIVHLRRELGRWRRAPR